MRSVDPSSVSPESLHRLDELVAELPADKVRDAVATLLTALRSGQRFAVVPDDAYVTTSQAARILGMSRRHLEMVIDAGDLAVTSDRDVGWISVADLTTYAGLLEQARAEAPVALSDPDVARAAALQAYKDRRRTAMR